MNPFPVLDCLEETSVRHGVEWSVCVRDIRSGDSLLELHPDRVLKTASIGKLFLLAEIARQAEAGELSLSEPVDRRTEDAISDSGLWNSLDADIISIDDACRFVGAFSDNLATNVLIGRVGIPAVAAATASLGFTVSGLLDRVRSERLPEHPPTLSRGSASELSALLAALADGTVFSAGVSARVLDWITLNTDLSMVASAFGLDPLAHPEADRGITLRNKTGTVSTVRADVGSVAVDDRWIAYAVLANWGENASPEVRDDVLLAMRAVGDWIRRPSA